MALEKLHGTQIVTWHPPLPQRAFRILSAGVTSDNTNIGGMAQDGKRYGYFTVDSTTWSLAEGFHMPPVQPGEQFQIGTAGPAYSVFFDPPAFGNGTSLSGLVNDNAPSANSPDLFNVSANEIAGPPGATYLNDVSTANAAFSTAATAMTAVQLLSFPSTVSFQMLILITTIINSKVAMSQAQAVYNTSSASAYWKAAVVALNSAVTAGQNAATACSAAGLSSQATTINTAVSAMQTASADALTCETSAINAKQNRDGVNTSFVPMYLTKDATVRTIIAVQQVTSTSWSVFFSPPTGVTIVPQQDGIITVPRPFNPKHLGRVGHVSAINYSYSLPGGPDQLTCLLQIEPNFRTDAMNPGRIVTAHRGSSCIWEGILTEPSPSTTGWTLTANGVGTYGTNFGAWWQHNPSFTGTPSSSWNPDGPVDLAIARGLRWLNRGIGKPAGIYVGPQQNPGSLTITDFMNLLCTGGSIVWELVQPASAASWPPGPWELTLYNLPTDQNGNPLIAGPPQKVQIGVINGGKWKRWDLLVAKPRRPPDLFLVNTSPIGRTIVADYNTIILYYQATPDVTATSTKKAKAATFSTTFVDNPASVELHGRMEYFLDISNAGAMSRLAAQKIGLNILSKYIRANFTSAFSVQPGQLLNPGGVPVDLGCNWNGHVCTVQGVNAAQGGEVGLAPLTFIIGQYQFDDDTQTASVTPYQNVKTDLASVIASLYPGKFA